mmetsp:Transcript_11134/g.25252  ORF Transcript_11134/g.25252 Transcript_11134/m.25252 type:complete len:691 (-) Transcript_11134:142-2214(-)
MASAVPAACKAQALRQRPSYLRVDADLGAGIEVSFEAGAGYLVEAICAEPGQDFQVGNLLVAIDGKSLALSTEEEADAVLAAALEDGVQLSIGITEGGECSAGASEDEEVIQDRGKAPSLICSAPTAPAEEACHAAPAASGGEIAADPWHSGQDPWTSSQATSSKLRLAQDTDRFDQAWAAAPAKSLGSTCAVAATEAAKALLLSSPSVADVHAAVSAAEVAPLENAASFRGTDTPGRTSTEALFEAGFAAKAEIPRPESTWEPSDPWQSGQDPWSSSSTFRPTSKIVESAATAGNLEASWQSGPQALPPEPRFSALPTKLVQAPASAAPPLDQEGRSSRTAACSSTSTPHSQEQLGQQTSSAQRLPHSVTSGKPESMRTGKCKVQDLSQWLEDMCLQEYEEEAAQWCIDMGAALLEELAENADDFAEALSLKPIERQRLQKWVMQILQQPQQCLVRGADFPATPQRFALGWTPKPMLQDIPRQGLQPRLSAGSTQQQISWGQAMSEEKRSWKKTPKVQEIGEDGQEIPETDAEEPVLHLCNARPVRLSMDSQGNTGLDLSWDAEWGVVVEGVDPLPGQPGLMVGDRIVAVDGCSLRRRAHEECDALFVEHLKNGALLSVVSPSTKAPHWSTSSFDGLAPTSKGGRACPLVQPVNRGSVRAGSGAFAALRRNGGGYDANRMWSRFRRPPW